MAQNMSSSTMENLARLASKPGVQSTLVLSKVDGAIIRSTGLASKPQPPSPSATDFRRSVASSDGMQHSFGDDSDGKAIYESENGSGQKTAEEVAKMVYSFVSGADGLVNGLDEGNEIQLLRLRTKKIEIVIVPDAKYLLVVIHDAPKGP